MEKEQTVKSFALLILGVGLLGLGLYMFSLSKPTSEGMVAAGDGTSWDNFVVVSLKKAGTNEWMEVSRTPNTVTIWGRNVTRDVLGWNAYANITNLTLSTGTTAPAITDSVCEATIIDNTNALGPRSGVVTLVSNGNYSVSALWTATGAQAGIAKVCLKNTTTNTTQIFASAKFASAVNMEANDQLNVTYYIAATST